jgi:hypothetical protein
VAASRGGCGGDLQSSGVEGREWRDWQLGGVEGKEWRWLAVRQRRREGMAAVIGSQPTMKGGNGGDWQSGGIEGRGWR